MKTSLVKGQSFIEYVSRIKSWIEELKAAGHVVSESEKLVFFTWWSNNR